MAQIKISELTTLAQQLQAADYMPVVHAGVTYKYSPYTYLVKNSGNETIAGVKTFSSSPIVPDATTATQVANLTNVTKAVTPLSDLSRVMQINGDGVPQFPDNATGVTYRYDSAWTSWVARPNSTIAVSVGILTATCTATGGSLYWGASRSSITIPANRIFRIFVKASFSRTINLYTGSGGTETIIGSITTIKDMYVPFDVYSTISADRVFIVSTSGNIGETISLQAIYIGSGLYDTPVYDKACCNRFTNYGVLPVKGLRGQALSFNGAQYLQADNPVIGTTGTIAFKFKRDVLGTSQQVYTNSSLASNGIIAFFNTSNILRLGFSNGTAIVNSGTKVINDIITYHGAILCSDGKVYYDGVLSADTIPTTWIQGLRNLAIGYDGSGSYLSAIITDFRYDSRIWTQDDVTRYHNGNDAVDSQQKAITNVPHSLATRDSKGNLRQPGLPVYADNTAALAGGLVAGEQYRTSTGVLMVVF
ncbi:MAG: hypothetical protein ACRDBM_02530 [Sporomusa sp.]